MSTNTLNGINLAAISEEILATLEAQMFMLAPFAKDISSDVVKSGESITTRVATGMTAVDVANGYTASNLTSTARTVVLDKEFGFPMAFKDSEVSKAGSIDFLRRIFIRPAVNAVLRKIVADGLALVTNANFTSNSVITAANFTYANVVDIDVHLENANALPDRSLLISPSYAGTLRKDTFVAAYVGNGPGNEQMIRYGQLGPIGGFNTYSYNSIPANSENLAGIAMAPEALIMAARMPAIDSTFEGEFENIVEPVTGLPLQLRKFYVPLQKRTYITVEAFYGWNVGVAANLRRILSA